MSTDPNRHSDGDNSEEVRANTEHSKIPMGDRFLGWFALTLMTWRMWAGEDPIGHLKYHYKFYIVFVSTIVLACLPEMVKTYAAMLEYISLMSTRLYIIKLHAYRFCAYISSYRAFYKWCFLKPSKFDKGSAIRGINKDTAWDVIKGPDGKYRIQIAWCGKGQLPEIQCDVFQDIDLPPEIVELWYKMRAAE